MLMMQLESCAGHKNGGICFIKSYCLEDFQKLLKLKQESSDGLDKYTLFAGFELKGLATQL